MRASVVLDALIAELMVELGQLRNELGQNLLARRIRRSRRRSSTQIDETSLGNAARWVCNAGEYTSGSAAASNAMSRRSRSSKSSA